MNHHRPNPTRRAMIGQSALLLAAPAFASSAKAADAPDPSPPEASLAQRAAAGHPDAKPALRIGLLTDLHYADKDPRINRFYRQSLDKTAEALAAFDREQAHIAIELGDIVDKAADHDTEVDWLKRIEALYATFPRPRHYVLGNHCLGSLDKAEFADLTGLDAPHLAFDRRGVRCIILDACFTAAAKPYARDDFAWSDSFIPPQQIDWLSRQLAAAKGPVVVFVHQLLDGDDDEGLRPYTVANAPAVRAALEQAPNLVAVFQGHYHRSRHRRIRGVSYVTLAALVEGDGADHNAYALLDVFSDASARLIGYREQPPHTLTPQRP